MVSKYTKRKILLSKIFEHVKYNEIDNQLFTSDLAKYIYDNQSSILGATNRIQKPINKKR